MGAPLGNQNAAKSRKFEQAVTRALTQEDGKRLRDAAEKVLDLAAAGERWACEMLRDTLDGKPAQAVTVAGDPDSPPVQHSMEVVLVRASGATGGA